MAQPPGEYQVKAAFLLNFTRFVEWPPGAFESTASAFVICILGDDPFGNVLDQVVEGESVGGHRVAVRRIRRPKTAGCHILFIPAGEKDTGATVGSLETGVLTVGEGAGFLKEGGIIAFVLQERRVRFDVNLRAAAKASLGINARMLAVARSVQR